MSWNNKQFNEENMRQKNPNNISCNRTNFHNMIMNIRDLNASTENVKIRGLVISKSPVRIVRVNYDKESGESSHGFKGVFNFAIRDSVTDFITVTSWGKSEYIKKIYNNFHMGDVVCVSNANIEIKKMNNQEYNVQTSSQFNLVISEKHSSIELYYGGDRNFIIGLQNTLLYSMSDHVTLLDMILFMESSAKDLIKSGQHFTFLAMVSKIGEIQDLISKSLKDENGQSKILHKLDVVLMDETCAAFPLTIWDQEWINFVKINWVPRVTVISLADCKVKYDEYKRGMVGVIDGRTISIQNPDVMESHKLHSLINVQNVLGCDISNKKVTRSLSDTFNVGSMINDDDIPLTSIQNVVTVKTLKSRSIDTEYGIIYGVLAHFNLDSEDPLQNLISLRCKNCKRRIMPKQSYCSTIDCPMLGENVSWTNRNAVEVSFHTVINICDHTGTLTKCSISDQVMEGLICCSPYQLIELNQDIRAKMKWELFLNRFKFYVKSCLPSFDNSSPFTKVLGIQIPTVFEILTSVKE